MEWDYGLYEELKDLEYCIDALKNNFYDTHNLSTIADKEEEIKERIEYLTSNLPIENTTVFDYDWDFEQEKLVKL